MEHAPTLASSRIATYQACDAINYTFFLCIEQMVYKYQKGNVVRVTSR